MSGAEQAHTPHRARSNQTVAEAEGAAQTHGLPSFDAWRAGLERRYTVMPLWYWNDQHCRANYVSHIRAAIDWQRLEGRINCGNAGFYSSLTR